jgi:hypothetical protein
MTRYVLGLDQASTSGWGIAPERGPVVRHGLARNAQERLAVVRLALEYVGGDARLLWAVLEQHDHFPLERLGKNDKTTARQGKGFVQRGPKQIAGLHKAAGRWLEQLELVGVPDTHISEVRPTTWRARIHGVTKGDQIKQAAMDWASARAGEPITQHDHAEGYCVTAWAALDGFARYDHELAVARIGARDKRGAAKQLGLPDMPRPKTLGRVASSTQGRF